MPVSTRHANWHQTVSIANNSIVDLHLQAGETEAALDFAKSLEATDAAQSASLQAKVLLGADRAEEAVEVVTKAFQSQPSANMARSLFAVRRQAGLEDEAIDGLRAWLVDNPDDFAGLELLSQALLVKQDYPSAAAMLEQALQLTPNNPTVLNNLAWLRHELEQAGAIDLARRAQQLAPNSPEITDTLAWILVQEGQIEEGLPLLREAQAALEDNPDIRYHLAYALQRERRQAGRSRNPARVAEGRNGVCREAGCRTASSPTAITLFMAEPSLRMPARQLTLLHVFPTFALGGSQRRSADLMNAFKDRHRHLVISIDGRKETAQRLDADCDIAFHAIEVRRSRGIAFDNLARLRSFIRQQQPDLLLT